MSAVVYSLCALTSAVCAVLLLHSYSIGKYRLLLWSGLCFAGLAANYLLLVVDKLILLEVDLSLLRLSVALAAMCTMLYGLVWDTE